MITTPKRTRKASAKLKVEAGAELKADAGYALLLDSSPGGGHVRQVKNIVLRKHRNGTQWFLIPVSNQDGTPLADHGLISYITSHVNSELKKSTPSIPVRVRWIEHDGSGKAVNAFLAVPAEKYKEIIGK